MTFADLLPLPRRGCGGRCRTKRYGRRCRCDDGLRHKDFQVSWPWAHSSGALIESHEFQSMKSRHMEQCGIGDLLISDDLWHKFVKRSADYRWSDRNKPVIGVRMVWPCQTQ